MRFVVLIVTFTFAGVLAMLGMQYAATLRAWDISGAKKAMHCLGWLERTNGLLEQAVQKQTDDVDLGYSYPDAVQVTVPLLGQGCDVNPNRVRLSSERTPSGALGVVFSDAYGTTYAVARIEIQGMTRTFVLARGLNPSDRPVPKLNRWRSASRLLAAVPVPGPL